MMKKTVLYIDGQNFLARIRSILRRRGVGTVDITKFDFWGLLNKVFQNEQVDLASFYFAKLHAEKETEEKSKELLVREETLKAELEQKGFKYVTAGTVRSRRTGDEIEFQEKGVDVSIAVDIVTDVLAGGVTTVLLASSDSDLQPAVKSAKTHGASVLYVGFRSRPNRGLMLTADRHVLISNDDVAAFYPDTALPAAAQSAEAAPASERTGRRRRRRRGGHGVTGSGQAPSQSAQPREQSLPPADEGFNEPPWLKGRSN